ncbi:MAG: hypothetical protein MRJ67_17195 [Nitrospirales bacterium]|nr:hypothetical protein [Nitrospirales bacterium]
MKIFPTNMPQYHSSDGASRSTALRLSIQQTPSWNSAHVISPDTMMKIEAIAGAVSTVGQKYR